MASDSSASPTTPATPSGSDSSSPDAASPEAASPEAETIPGDKTLDAFEAACGLPGNCPPEVESEATRLLVLTPAEVRRLTPAACGEAAFVLEQFAFFLQRAANREQARVTRAEARTRRLLPPLLAGRREVMWEEKKLRAIASDPATRACERLKAEAQLKLDRLAYLAGRVTALSRLLLNLQQTRGRDDG